MDSDKIVGPCSRGCCPSQAEHYRSLVYSKAGIGTKHDRERKLSADMEAYRRLRKQGLQPPRIDGASVTEKHATTKAEVESGAVIWKKGEVCRPWQVNS